MRFIFILLLTTLDLLHPQAGWAHAAPKAGGAVETQLNDPTSVHDAIAHLAYGPSINTVHSQPSNSSVYKLAVQTPGLKMPWLPAFTRAVSDPVLWTRPLRHQLLFPQHYFW